MTTQKDTNHRRHGRRPFGRRKPGAATSRVRPYLPADLTRRLEAKCGAVQLTVSAAVTEAVEQWVEASSDWTLLLRRLNRQDHAIARLQRDGDFHAKAFANFVFMWLEHTPPLAPAARAAARESAAVRYREFARNLVDEFQEGRRFVDDLPRVTLADDAELDALRDAADHTKPKDGKR